MSFFTHFDFESVLSSNTHNELTYIIAKGVVEVLISFCYPCILFISSQLFFSLLHDKHFETNEKISDRFDESNTLFYNIIHRLVGWVGWIHFLFSSLFSRENCIWSSCFLFITAWFSLDTFDETTSWIILEFPLLVGLLRLVCLLMLGQ